MYLIVGLGNPGTKYKGTRHNTGFEIIDLLGRMSGIRLVRRYSGSKSGFTRIGDTKVMLFCPMSFMNLSGEPVRKCVDRFNIKRNHILVVHDDLDLPLGRLKIVSGGGAGGHKGVLSIIERMGSKEFARLKVGIGRPPSGISVDEYVLSPFHNDEREIVEKIFLVAAKGCELFVLEGVDSAMNYVNSQRLTINL